MNELISVIIPVYNVEKFIEKCLESVINQTYTNLEIIIVNDGSKDNSGVICEQYVKSDSRIKYFEKKNGGLASARNYGLDKASGKYILFLDSDDFMSLNAVEVLLNNLKNSGADVTIGEIVMIKKFDDVKPEIKDCSNIKQYTYDNFSAIENMLYEIQFSSSANRILYKACLFDDVRFPLGKTYEDLFTIYKVLYKCEVITFVDFPVYYYVIRSGSIISNLNPIKNVDFLNAALEIHDFIEKKCPDKVKAADYKLFVASIELFVKYPPQEELSRIDLDKKVYIWNIIKKNRLRVILDRNSLIKYRVLAVVSFLGKNIVTNFYKKVAKR